MVPRWLKIALCWLKLASRCPKWPPIANLDQFLTKNCSFWNALDLQNIEKTIGFIGPFASCTFLFLLMIFEPLSWLKLAPSWLKLAKLSKFEPKLSQVGSKLAQVGSKLGPSWLHVGSSWAQGPKMGPGRVQEGLPVRSKRVLGGSRWLQELKWLSGPLQGPIFDRFLIDF